MATTRKNNTDVQALNNQLRVSIPAAILQALGPEHSVRILSADVSVENLNPEGIQLAIRVTADIYPKAP